MPNHKTILFLLLHLASTLFGKAILLNGTAATVGKELITVQDAYIYRAIQRYKAGESPAVLIEKGEDLKRTTQKAAFEVMVYLEIKSIEFELGVKADVEKEMLDLKKKRKPQELKSIQEKFHLTEKVVADRLYKSNLVERFMQKKVDTLTPIITDQESEKYFQENTARFKGNTYQQMKPNIQVLLKKQQIQKGLEEWVQFLKEKYGFAILLEE